MDLILAVGTLALIVSHAVVFAIGFKFGDKIAFDEGYDIGQIDRRRIDRQSFVTRK